MHISKKMFSSFFQINFLKSNKAPGSMALQRFLGKKKLGSFFPIKDNIIWEHESDVVYHYGCTFSINCNYISVSNYVGETNVRIGTRAREHYTDPIRLYLGMGKLQSMWWMIPISKFWLVGKVI